jgi:hypothetical protein
VAPQPTPVPLSPQFGVGLFEAGQTFQGYAGYRWSYSAGLGHTLVTIDAGLGATAGAALGTSSGGVVLPPGYITTAGQDGFGNVTHGMTRTQYPVVKHLVQQAQTLEGLGASVEATAAAGLDTRKAVVRASKPRTIIRYIKPNVKALTAPLVRRVAEAEARAQAAEQANAQLASRVARLERALGKEETVAVPGIDAALGRLGRRVGGIERQVQRLGKYVGLGAFLLLLARALEKIGGQFIRCSNVKKWGKSMCGINPSLLESLLADVLMIASLVSIVEFAKELQTIESEVAKGIRYGVRELKPGFVPTPAKLR